MSTSTSPITSVADAAGFPPAPPEALLHAEPISYLERAPAPHNESTQGVCMSNTTTAFQADEASMIEAAPSASLTVDEREFFARDLVRHPLNVRKSGGEDVTELKALILAQTLLQNLVVALMPKQRKGKERYGVVAGGRRLKAILELIAEGKLPRDYRVRCRVVSYEQARATSTAENAGREPMSLPDLVEAFAQMHAEGVSIDDLALCFGLTPLTVQRRLRLASVAPELLELVRLQEMTHAQLEALALTDDQETQVRVWHTTPAHNRHPGTLRNLVAGEAVAVHESALARYVTLATYEKAGGEVLRDLFDQNDAGRLTNHELLQQLALAKLERKAQKVKAQHALPWVDVRLQLSHTDMRSLYREPPTVSRTPTDAEATELAEAQAALDVAEKNWDQHDDSDESEEASNIGRTLHAALESAQERLAALEEALIGLPEGAGQVVGAVVFIDSQGNAATKLNIVHVEDYGRLADAARAARTKDEARAGVEDGQADTPTEEAGFSRALLERLSANKTVALQAELARQPQLALAAVVHAMKVSTDPMRRSHDPSCLGIAVRGCEGAMGRADENIEASPAWAAIKELEERCDDVLPGQPGTLLEWLAGQSVEVLLNLLAYYAARSACTMGPGDQAGASLATLLGLDMANWWKPTADSFFRHVSKAQIAEVVGTVRGAEQAEEIATLKKPEAATRAEQLLQDSRWLPEALRA